jgi:dipeptidyl aminopeptidase/acylaminoacyl peptidase
MSLHCSRVIALVALLAAGSVTRAQPPAPTAAGEVGLAYFQPDDFRLPKISPGAKSVGFIARTGSTTKLFRLDLASGKIEGVFDPGEGDIENFWWADDSRILIDARGKRGLTYFALNLSDGKTRELKNLARSYIQEVVFRRGSPGVMYFARFNEWSALDLDTGKERLLGRVKGSYEQAVLSAQGEILSEAWMDRAIWHVRWRASAKAPWQEIEGKDSLPAFVPVGLYHDERRILVSAFDQGDTAAVMLLDPTTGERTSLAQRSDRDVGGLLTTTSNSQPYGVRFFGVTEADHAIFVPEIATFLRRLKGALPGENTRFVDSTADGSVRIVANWNTGQPWTYYLYAGGRLAVLNRQREAPPSEALGSTQRFAFTNRDGRQLHGSVVLPPQTSGPCALIIRGPAFVAEAADDTVFYDAETQYLVSRGYAVATFALRGQWGYGRSFADAGKLSLKDRLVGDLEDGVRHLIDRGIADPQRVVLDAGGARALFALYAARPGSPYTALVIRNPRDKPEADDLQWQFDGTRQLFDMYQEVSGVHNAYQLMQSFDPAVTVPKIRVPVMLVGAKVPAVTTIENLLRSNKRDFVRYETSWSDHQQEWPRQWYEMLRAIGDFLDTRLPSAAP